MNVNEDIGIKIQAWLDGELTGKEKAEVDRLLSESAECRLLRDELMGVRVALRGNEPAVKLPENPDFYWSQIRRRIEAEEPRLQPAPTTATATAATATGMQGWLRRYLLPLSGVAAAALVLVTTLQQPNLGPLRPASLEATAHEVSENVYPDSDFFTFRSDSQGVTLVWVSDRNTASSSSDSDE